MQTRVEIIHEVPAPLPQGEWVLCFHWCRYWYADGTTEEGYRFMWRDEKGRLKPTRGRARIPSADELEDLIAQAKQAGWYRRCET